MVLPSVITRETTRKSRKDNERQHLVSMPSVRTLLLVLVLVQYCSAALPAIAVVAPFVGHGAVLGAIAFVGRKVKLQKRQELDELNLASELAKVLSESRR